MSLSGGAWNCSVIAQKIGIDAAPTWCSALQEGSRQTQTLVVVNSAWQEGSRQTQLDDDSAFEGGDVLRFGLALHSLIQRALESELRGVVLAAYGVAGNATCALGLD